MNIQELIDRIKEQQATLGETDDAGCCTGEGSLVEPLGDLSSALSDLEDGGRRGEVRSLRVSDSEAGAVEVPAAAVVDE
jgi:hypothetical protein